MQGEAFWKCLETGVFNRKDKIAVDYETRGRTLVKNDKGEVIGLIAEKDGKKVAYKARKAVVLCTGGYEYSKTMRQAFMKGLGLKDGHSTARFITKVTAFAWGLTQVQE